MISQDVLDDLACPACKLPLTLLQEPERLKCAACRRVYPVSDEVPIMLIDQATIDPS
jgi:LSD1 subclass zinc finger protein